MKKLMMILSLTLVGSAMAADTQVQEKNEQVRKVMVKSYNSLLTVSDSRISQEATVISADLRKRGKVLLAEKVETLAESPRMKNLLLEGLRTQIADTSENGLFLVGWAICKAIAAHNGGWCYEPTENDAGSIGPVAFALLSIATLGQKDAASDF